MFCVLPLLGKYIVISWFTEMAVKYTLPSPTWTVCRAARVSHVTSMTQKHSLLFTAYDGARGSSCVGRAVW